MEGRACILVGGFCKFASSRGRPWQIFSWLKKRKIKLISRLSDRIFVM